MKIILNNEINVVIIISIKLLKYSNINYTPTLILQHVIFALKLLQLHPLAQTKKKSKIQLYFHHEILGNKHWKYLTQTCCILIWFLLTLQHNFSFFSRQHKIQRDRQTYTRLCILNNTIFTDLSSQDNTTQSFASLS